MEPHEARAISLAGNSRWAFSRGMHRVHLRRPAGCVRRRTLIAPTRRYIVIGHRVKAQTCHTTRTGSGRNHQRVFNHFPGADQAQFRLWMTSLRAFRRYPELTGLAEVVIVPQRQLARFESNSLRDPAGTLAPNDAFGLSPAGNRPYYCLAKEEMTRIGQVREPAGLDFCDSPLGPLFLKARDTGRGAYFPYGTGTTEEFVVGTPIYSTGSIPRTVQARRASFIGWTGTLTQPNVLLATALKGHANVSVVFTYGIGSSAVRFTAGHAANGAASTDFTRDNGWRIQVLAPVDSASVFANANALALFLSGVILSFLLGALIYLLSTSRSRALGLVTERTRELEHLALHDPLTDFRTEYSFKIASVR